MSEDSNLSQDQHTPATSKEKPNYFALLRKLANPKAIAAITAAGAVGVGTTQGLTPKEQADAIKHVSPAQSQRDGKYPGGTWATWRTCNLVSGAMWVSQMRPLIGKAWVKDDDFIESARKRGLEPTIHENVSLLTKVYGIESYWSYSKDYKKLIDTLEKGYSVEVNILHKGSVSAPYGGHLVVVTAYDKERKEFYIQDPWGELNAYNIKPYRTSYVLSEAGFKARWQGGARYLTDKQIEAIVARAKQVGGSEVL